MDVKFDYSDWFCCEITPAWYYAKLPLPVPENRSNLSSFFYKNGWLDHIKGYTPEDLYEARRLHQEVEKHGDALCKAAQRYLTDIQDQIQDHVVFGLLKDIGSIDS